MRIILEIERLRGAMLEIKVSKELTANDVGATGSHQLGIAIPKSGPMIDFFPRLDWSLDNPDVMLNAVDMHSGERLAVRYVYYNNSFRGGTRNEFRLTRVSSFLSKNHAVEGDVLVIAKRNDGSFLFAIERLLPTASSLGPVDFTDTKIRDGWTIGVPSPGLKADDESYAMEGGELLVVSRRYERSPLNRRLAIEMHGRTCTVCQFSFDEIYGPLADGYVEIHHLVPVSTLNGPTSVDPQTDLVPLYANCHRMVHRRWPPYAPEDLREAMHQFSGRPD
jgi:hypothetical protein